MLQPVTFSGKFWIFITIIIFEIEWDKTRNTASQSNVKENLRCHDHTTFVLWQWLLFTWWVDHYRLKFSALHTETGLGKASNSWCWRMSLERCVSSEIQHSRYLENWYLEAGLDLEASDFWKANFLGLKESGFRDQSGFRDRGCWHGGCSLNPDSAVLAKCIELL